LLVGTVAPADAQRAGPPAAVQLPTFSRFSVGTTVSVPDRGAVRLGGVNRSADGRQTYGAPGPPMRPWRNSALGSRRSASNMSVNVWVHDFEAMDRYLLSQPDRRPAAPAGRGALSNPQGDWVVPGDRLSPSAPPAGEPLPSVAQLRADRARRQAARASEADQFFHRGRSAQADGKTSVAAIYYRMAARRATGPLKQEILAALLAMENADEGAVAAADR